MAFSDEDRVLARPVLFREQAAGQAST